MKKTLALIGIMILVMTFVLVACSPKATISINQQDQSLYCGDSVQLSATATGGEVAWKIDGDALGSTISSDGLFTAGQQEGNVVVKAYISGNESVSDSITISIIKESSQEPSEQSISIDGDDVLNYCFGDVRQLTATVSGGNAVWEITGEALGSEISSDGILTIGQEEGSITVRAYLDSNEDISDTVTVNITEPTYGVASALGTSHNNIILTKSFTYTFRTYFKVREYGEFDYAFYYDNVLDTTWWNVPEATANTKGARFEILGAYFADGGTALDGSVVEGTSKAITFGGQTTKSVAPGEEFTSDDVLMNIPEGHFLAFTWTIKVSTTSGGSVPFTESTFATCFKKQGEFASQESEEGFVTGNAMFGDQVLVAPNKILYQHPVEKQLAFIGDSITQGVSTRKDMYEMWVAKVADQLPDTYSVWNLGSGWATAGNLASDGAWLKKAATADEVFICVGVNDLGGNISLSEYQQLIRTIIDALREKNPDIVITLFTVPPFNYSGSQGDTWFAMNEWIRQRNIEGVDKYFDFAAVLSQDAPNENYLKDNYMSSASDPHPNGIAGTDVAENFINWYNEGSSEVEQVYESYVNVDLGQSFTLPTTVKVKTVGGYLEYRPVVWDKAASTETAGITTYMGTVDGTTIKAKFTLRVRNTIGSETVYEVHCANSLPIGSELSNSVYDQVFGVDSVTGKQWGYVNEGIYATTQFWENNPSKWEGVRASNAGLNDILYKFELEAGTYTLSLGFKDHWWVTRIMELSIDGVVVDESLNNGGGVETTKTYTFTVESDKIVEILLHETTNSGANLHWLSISRASIPSENDLLEVRPGSGFVVLEWSSAFNATSYEVWYGTQSGSYTQCVKVDGLSTVIGGLTNGTQYYFAVRGVNELGEGGFSNEIMALPVAVADSNVLYYADSGNTGLVYLEDQMGIYQSTEDQKYGVDPVTGKTWGYTVDGSEWLSGNPMAENSVLVANIKDIGKLVGYGIHYKFEVPEGSFTVEITFYDEWNVEERYADVLMEGEKVLSSYNGGRRYSETLSFDVTVTDGMLDIDIVGAEGNTDNIMVASIKIIQK